MDDRLGEFYNIIRRFEGCRLIPYWCPAGVLTVGWGATGSGVMLGRAWTQAQADARLQADSVRFAVGTLAACPILGSEPDRRLSAVVSFAYNLGLGNLKASTLRKRINAGKWADAVRELVRWNKAGGVAMRGLTLRRSAESVLLA